MEGKNLLDKILGTQSMTNKPENAAKMERGLARMEDELLLENAVESCRARLAQKGLEHVVILSQMEERAMAVAPGGQARYKFILDKYTSGVAERIERWQKCWKQ